MANKVRGDVDVEALGKKYIFRMGINELIDIQDAFEVEDDETFLDMLGNMKGTKKLRLVASKCLLDEAGSPVDEREAGDIVTDITVGAFIGIVVTAMKRAWAEPEEGAEKPKGKAPASPGASSSSTAPEPG